MVTLSLTRSMDSETDGHAMVITVAWRCGESVVKLITCGSVSISHAACLPCDLDLIDTRDGRSSADAEVQSKNSAECSARFGSATWLFGRNSASFVASHLRVFALVTAVN